MLKSGVVENFKGPWFHSENGLYSFAFIPVHDKRLFDPSGLSSDVYLCFRLPGNPPCRLLHVKKSMTHLGHHSLTFDSVYTSVKRYSSPFQA